MADPQVLNNSRPVGPCMVVKPSNGLHLATVSAPTSPCIAIVNGVACWELPGGGPRASSLSGLMQLASVRRAIGAWRGPRQRLVIEIFRVNQMLKCKITGFLCPPIALFHVSSAPELRCKQT